MSDGLAWFNSLGDEEAQERLYACLALRNWASNVVAARPFESVSQLMARVEAEMDKLIESDWLQAFKAHPRIGERGGHSAATSEREQSRAMQAPDETLTALRVENQAYEQKFGHIFLIAAAGRSADEILGALRERMGNDPMTEIEVAADEQRKIARLRVLSLLDR